MLGLSLALSACNAKDGEPAPGGDVSEVADQVEALRNGAIDVALLRPPLTDGTLTLTPLREERLVVAVPENHRLAARGQVRVADLAGTDLIIHSAGRRSAMYDVVEHLLTDAGITPTIRHEVGETSTMITLVAGGLGVAVVPEPVTALPLAGVAYRPLVRPARRIGLAVAHRAERREPHLRRTLEVITALARR